APAGGGDDAAACTCTVPDLDTALPTASVAVTVAAKAPALAYACWTAAPVAAPPSPNDHLSVTGPSRSLAVAANATGVPASAVPRNDTASSAGGLASKPRACRRAGAVPCVHATMPSPPAASPVTAAEAAPTPALTGTGSPKAPPGGRVAAISVASSPNLSTC